MTDPAAPMLSHALGRESLRPRLEDLPLSEQAGESRPYLLRFTGEVGDYFRIWIVNLALSIVTLGLFLPWAKVRQRAYLYGHTRLDGHGFEYTADPKALLRGYLLMGGLFALGNISMTFAETKPELLWIPAALFLVLGLAYPWLLMKSLRFNAFNSRYRNLRFRFTGGAGGAYMAYMLGNIVVAFSGGLARPWLWYMQRDYQLSNLSYGRTPFRFDGDVGDFFLIGLKAAGLYLAAFVVTMMAGGVLATGALESDHFGLWEAVRLVFFGVLAAFSFGMAAQFVNSAVLDYLARKTTLGGVLQLRSRINVWELTWIGMTNLLAQYVTLGLATPWATVRRQRYITSHLLVTSTVGLEHFRGAYSHEEDALGEAAADLFGLDIGL